MSNLQSKQECREFGKLALGLKRQDTEAFVDRCTIIIKKPKYGIKQY